MTLFSFFYFLFFLLQLRVAHVGRGTGVASSQGKRGARGECAKEERVRLHGAGACKV
jgi:hypothetical protein